MSSIESHLSNKPKQVFFNPINIFDTFTHSITLLYIFNILFSFNVNFFNLQEQRRCQYLSTLWSIHTEDFSMAFDVEKAEVHLEHDDDGPIALWNEFHMRRTRLNLNPSTIVDEL